VRGDQRAANLNGLLINASITVVAPPASIPRALLAAATVVTTTRLCVPFVTMVMSITNGLASRGAAFFVFFVFKFFV
jgi:hypothetical protein